ncbi:ATP-binding protein [Cohnella terricola]|uniref:ATP-binding protein n=1 Tax=Cohnella terricola TaxID=1289167 RepID=A0A559JQM8_9BACL|nr:ATP-binding protein [Cohnella terricola]TVY02168.1 ATP-binding protein [Cohnella terricola]
MNRPNVTPGTHPIEQGHYIVPTREVLRLMESMIKIVANRMPGMIVYGRPRIGKSKAVEYALNYLPNKLGAPIPIFITNSNLYRVPSEEKFFKDILNDFHLPDPIKRKPTELRRQIVNLLMEHGEKSRLRRVILIIDEAHRLTEYHYNWLMDIYNELDRMKISMTVICIGQPELLSRRTYFLEQKKAQIIGRFMTHEHEFFGIRSKDDIRFLFKCYDQVSEYPENSGWSYTRYYFQEAFEQGDRLENSATEVFELFKEIRKEHGLSNSIEIPMEYLAYTVENAFKTYGANGEAANWLTVNHWREAIKSSGYIESEIYMALA